MSLLRRIEGRGKPEDDSQRKARLRQTSPPPPWAPDSALIQRLVTHIGPVEDEAALIARFDQLWAEERMSDEALVLSRRDLQRLKDALMAEVFGWGPLAPLLEDETIARITVTGTQPIEVYQKGALKTVPHTFNDEDHIRRTLARFVTLTEPVTETYLPDGSHLVALFSPVALNGPVVTIRKPAQATMTMQDLIRFNSLTTEVAEFLRACVVARINIGVIGDYNTGKSSMLNALASLIPEEEAIVTLEQHGHLNLPQPRIARLQAQGIDMGDLIGHALKLEADRVVLDAQSSAANFTLLDSLYPGQDGVLMTLYGNSPRYALHYLEFAQSTQKTQGEVRWTLAETLNILVTVKRLRDGSRKVVYVTEVQGTQGDMIILADLFEWEQTGLSEGRVIGRLRPTGLRPRLMERIHNAGIYLPPTVFGIGRRRPTPPPPDHSSKVEETPLQEEGTEAAEELPPEPNTGVGLRDESAPVEDVQFTMFHPKEAEAEKWYTALVYAHIESALALARQDAAKFSDEMNDDMREVHGRQAARLARGTKVTIRLEAEGVEFKPASLTLSWDEDVERASFRFKPSADLVGQPCFGEAVVYVGPLEIATIRFSIFITNALAEDAETPVATTTNLYQRIFASYSHQDTTVVQACIRAYKALGHDVAVDFESLRSGEEWNKALEQMIDEADIFQLFWSNNAAQSTYVEQEWRYALEKGKAAGFIRPVYWEQPTPPIPDSLGHLHFKYLPDLA